MTTRTQSRSVIRWNDVDGTALRVERHELVLDHRVRVVVWVVDEHEGIDRRTAYRVQMPDAQLDASQLRVLGLDILSIVDRTSSLRPTVLDETG